MQSVLTAVGVVGAFFTYKALKPQYTNHKDAPPYMAGLPFIGVLPQYSKDPQEFIASSRKKYGDVFSFYLMGKKMVFVCDPHMFPKIYKDPKLNFVDIKAFIMEKVFGYNAKKYLEFVHKIETIDGSQMSGSNVAKLTQRFIDQLIPIMDKSKDGRSEDLWDWSGKVLFYASTNALWKEDFANDQLFYDLRAFDKDFALLVAGLPDTVTSYVAKKSIEMQKKFIKFFNNSDYVRVSDVNELKRQHLIQEGYTEAIGSSELSFLWASQGNAAPAIFWSIALLATHKEARDALYEEVERVLKDRPITELADAIKESPKLDSLVSEVLRLYSSSQSIRVSTEDGELTATDGTVFHYKTGDTIMMPSTEVHFDDEIYENPKSFQWDRFLNQTKFMKNGKAVTKNEMAFGGGASWCPGRHFARSEMKAICAVLLHYFDFELEGGLPDVDKQRYSLGIYPPNKEVKIKLKSRQ